MDCESDLPLDDASVLKHQALDRYSLTQQYNRNNTGRITRAQDTMTSLAAPRFSDKCSSLLIPTRAAQSGNGIVLTKARAR